MNETDYVRVALAVAKAWTHPETSDRVFDPELAEIVTSEVLTVLYNLIDSIVMKSDRYRAALDTIVNGECYSLDAAREIARAALDGEA